MSRPPVVLHCQVGRRPRVIELTGGLPQMQAMVGGLVDCVELDSGLDVWFNDEGLLLGLPLNRSFPTIVKAPPPGPWDFVSILGDDDDRLKPGEVGEWRIHGDLFIARNDGRGNLTALTNDDIVMLTIILADEDPVAAAAMDAMRSLLRR